MNPNTEKALQIISQGLALVQGNLEMHRSLQTALEAVTQGLKTAPVESAADKNGTTG